MDNVNEEIAALESLLSQGLEQVHAVKRIARNDQPRSDETNPSIKIVNDADLIDRAENLLKWSRLKAECLNLGTGLFSDSCWDMCLDIYICDLKRQQITVSSVAHSSGIPMTTAMRYINVMSEEGLLEKTPNPSDNRMILVSTSTSCKQRISEVLKKFP
ncbi:MAG: helix-turn-helix domain-containing protein [Parasphingorhabdus sp.]